MRGAQVSILAEGGTPFPPGVEDYYLPALIKGAYPWLTKFTLLVWVAVALIIIFFLWANRNPQLVPSRKRRRAVAIPRFTRGGVAREIIGPEALRFPPSRTSLFCFILVTNVF